MDLDSAYRGALFVLGGFAGGTALTALVLRPWVAKARARTLRIRPVAPYVRYHAQIVQERLRLLLSDAHAAFDYVGQEHGFVLFVGMTRGTSFGTVVEDLEYLNITAGNLLARVIRDMPDHLRCAKPPAGWVCTRSPGHDGPCAAIEPTPLPEQAPDQVPDPH